MPAASRLSLLLLLTVLALVARPASGQVEELSLDERAEKAYDAAQRGRFVRARELATNVLRQAPESVTASLALGIALHEGEGNIPLALRQYRHARSLIETPLGVAADDARELHRQILFYELRALSDLGRYDELLALNAALRRLYDPELHSVDVWPLMKLGRVTEARAAIERALASEDRFEEVVARNGLCALDGYVECLAMLEAVQRHRFNPGLALRNAGVSAMLAGRVDEAERLLNESTLHPDEDTNPWRDLVDLYVLEGRLPEALAATQRMIAFGARLPPRERQYNRAEALVAGAKVLLLAGDAHRALAATSRALAEPDRAAHWSGSASELQAEGALVHAVVLRTLAESESESAAWLPLHRAGAARLRSLGFRLRSWLAGRRVLPLLLDGALRGRRDPADRDTPDVSGPMWLLVEAVPVLGPGPVLGLIREAREEPADERDAMPGELRAAQLDALETEARALRGERDGVLAAGRRALDGLPPAYALLRARVAVRMANAAHALGDAGRAHALYDEVLALDPGMIRRTGSALPVRLETTPGTTVDEAARRVLRSPRFTLDPSSPLALAAARGGLCLTSGPGTILVCADADGEEPADPGARFARTLLATAFAPRVDLAQSDLEGLDGSTTLERGLDLGGMERLLER